MPQLLCSRNAYEWVAREKSVCYRHCRRRHRLENRINCLLVISFLSFFCAALLDLVWWFGIRWARKWQRNIRWHWRHIGRSRIAFWRRNTTHYRRNTCEWTNNSRNFPLKIHFVFLIFDSRAIMYFQVTHFQQHNFHDAHELNIALNSTSTSAQSKHSRVDFEQATNASQNGS